MINTLRHTAATRAIEMAFSAAGWPQSTIMTSANSRLEQAFQ